MDPIGIAVKHAKITSVLSLMDAIKRVDDSNQKLLHNMYVMSTCLPIRPHVASVQAHGNQDRKRRLQR